MFRHKNTAHNLYEQSDCRKTSCLFKNGVAGAKPPYRSSAICATASCSGFVRLTASILAWTRGGSPSNIAPARMPGVYATRLCRTQSQPSIHSPSPRGRGLGFRQGRRDRTPKGFARTQSQQSVLKGIENLLYIYKNRLFLQADCS